MASLLLSVVRSLLRAALALVEGSPKPAKPPINTAKLLVEATEMRQAAWNMEKWAIGIAGLIATLFVAAVLVFIFAANVTKIDRRKVVTAVGAQLLNEKGEEMVVADDEPLVLDAQRQGLIFTSITRFGTLVLVFYAISISYNVFRYLIRGGNYYRARAHALLILAELSDKDADRYAVLVNAMSIERISFGKEPSTPLALAAEALASVKKKAE